MADIWDRAFQKQQGRCPYCGCKLLANFNSYMSVEFDHLIPIKDGGSATDEKNKVLTCNVCNRLKGYFNPSAGATTPATKGQLVRAARVHIAKRRAQLKEDYQRYLGKFQSANKTSR